MYLFCTLCIICQIRDARGKPIRESNTRIIKWSDGSYQLLIGDNNVIDLTLQDNVENTQYITSVEVLILLRISNGVESCE